MTEEEEFERLLHEVETNSLSQMQRHALARMIRTEEDAREVLTLIVALLERAGGGVGTIDGDAVGKIHLDDAAFPDATFTLDDRIETIHMFWRMLWANLDGWNAPNEMEPGIEETIRRNVFPTLQEYVAALSEVWDEDLVLPRALLAALEKAWPGACYK